MTFGGQNVRSTARPFLKITLLNSVGLSLFVCPLSCPGLSQHPSLVLTRGVLWHGVCLHAGTTQSVCSHAHASPLTSASRLVPKLRGHGTPVELPWDGRVEARMTWCSVGGDRSAQELANKPFPLPCPSPAPTSCTEKQVVSLSGTRLSSMPPPAPLPHTLLL